MGTLLFEVALKEGVVMKEKWGRRYFVFWSSGWEWH